MTQAPPPDFHAMPDEDLDPEELAALRAKIAAGDAAIAEGRTRPLDLDAILTEARRRWDAHSR